MKIQIPSQAEEIIRKLNEHGYEAYIVGGCVRDMLLGREPEDWDITTNALPEEVKQIFKRTVDTGIQHGTVTVMWGKIGYEITTYRVDGTYSDSRHPDQVSFTPDLEEDLKRRDFTINAMAFHSQLGLVDLFGGREDLEKHLIRCVGQPKDRFGEDALRILRAVRFSAQLGFAIEDGTYDAIGKIAPNLVHVSRERVQTELTKLLLSPNPSRIALVYEAGISPYVSSAFSRIWNKEGTGGRPVVWIPVSVPAVRHMRWAAFLRKCTPEQGVQVLKDLKMDNDTIYRVKTLLEWLNVPVRGTEGGKIPLRRMMSRMEPELFDDLLRFKLCLAEDQSGWMEHRPETIRQINESICLTEEIRQRGDCINLKMLAVTGHDIMKAGVRPGKEVGICLSNLLDQVLEDPSKNTKEYLLSRIDCNLEKNPL